MSMLIMQISKAGKRKIDSHGRRKQFLVHHFHDPVSLSR